MSDSVVSTIEKIKLQEHEQEVKLKEKREYEASIALLQRNIRDTISQNEKLLDEEKTINERIKKLVSQLELEKIKNKALVSEAEVLKTEHENLKDKINDKISNVWEIRSSFCEAVKQTSDEYDVWPLLMKPVYSEPIIRNKTPEKEILTIEGRLKEANERRENAIAERNRLLAEPDTGEEFVRIKNALRYSLEKIACLRK